MDGNRFDELSKALASGAHRRRFLKILAVGPLAAIAVRLGLHETQTVEAGAVQQTQTCTADAKKQGLACCEALFGPTLNSTSIILLNSTAFYPQCVTSVNGRPVRIDTQCEFKLCEYDVLHGKNGKGCQGICGGTCSGPSGCGPGCAGASGLCGCVTTSEQTNACVQQFCGGNSCTSSSQCPPGWVCSPAPQICCANLEVLTGQCVPLCNTLQGNLGPAPHTAPGAGSFWHR